MFSHIQISGMSVYLWQSSPTTIVIRKALRWHLLKLCMVKGVELPLNWSEPRERWLFGLDLVKETEEKVRRIQANMKAA